MIRPVTHARLIVETCTVSMIPDLYRILRDPAARIIERRAIRLTSFAVADFLRSTQPIDHGIIQRLHALRTIPWTATLMICPSLIGLVHGRARSQHGVCVPAPLRTRARLLDSSGNQDSCRSCLPRLRKPWSGMTSRRFIPAAIRQSEESASVWPGARSWRSWAPAARVRRLSSRWSTRSSNPLPDGSSCAIDVRPSGTRSRCDARSAT